MMLGQIDERVGEHLSRPGGHVRDAAGDLPLDRVRAADLATARASRSGGRFRQRQAQVATREIDQAVSLVGPHRDDFTFVLDGVDLNTYGSRGQQRLAVLA